MSFEFLAPDEVGPGAGGAPPPQRSPIEWAHLDAGARLGERAGWQVVIDYGAAERERRPAATRSGSPTSPTSASSSCRPTPPHRRRSSSALAGGAALELGRAALHDGTWWCPITAGRVMAVTPPERTAAVRRALEDEAGRARFASVTELTSAWGSNAVVGPPRAGDIRPGHGARHAPARFPEGAFAPVSVARTPAWSCARTATASCTCSAPAMPSTTGPCSSTPPRAWADARSASTRWAPRSPRGSPPVLDIFRKRRMWRRTPELKDRYEVVIVGGGSHGLAIAYYLARDHGITDVCDPREELHRLRRGGAQHDDPALQLQDARGRPLLRRLGEAVRAPRRRAQLQPAVQPGGPPDPGAHRPGDVRDGRARRGEPARGNRLEGDRSRGDRPSSRRRCRSRPTPCTR